MARTKTAKTIVVKLVSAAKTGVFYTTTKNPRNISKKMVFRKYDPVANAHVLFTEEKIKKG